jgi:hypothetical protein
LRKRKPEKKEDEKTGREERKKRNEIILKIDTLLDGDCSRCCT